MDIRLPVFHGNYKTVKNITLKKKIVFYIQRITQFIAKEQDSLLTCQQTVIVNDNVSKESSYWLWQLSRDKITSQQKMKCTKLKRVPSILGH